MIHSRSVFFLVSLFVWFFCFLFILYSQQPKNQPPNLGKLPPTQGQPPIAPSGENLFAPQPPIEEDE